MLTDFNNIWYYCSRVNLHQTTYSFLIISSLCMNITEYENTVRGRMLPLHLAVVPVILIAVSKVYAVPNLYLEIP